ncbi:MAG: response regulator [Sediminispirochaetaceae bacterium]
MDKRILIADDEGINRLFVKTVLVQDGWTVAEAVNGREALDLAGTEEFDIILLDIKMPVMDGREAVRRIRQLKQYSRGTSSTPILGLTAYSDDIIYRELEEDGMDGLILKPVTEKSLISQLGSYLSK